jgi:acyl-CoA dehydrogenase
VTVVYIVSAVVLFSLLAYQRASLSIWLLAFGLYLLLLNFLTRISTPVLITWWVIYGSLGLLMFVRPLRRALISFFLFKAYHQFLPPLSPTEKEALAAGTVDWDRELFSGMPNWEKCLAYPAPKLTEAEVEFIKGPVNELCALIDNWDITHNRFNLPDEIWGFLKAKKFFGMIIPKRYGGLEFSAIAHSNILTKIAARSISVGSVVAVPNSLGPAELLLRYGTEEQKNYYLPRLAEGKEIPCFALTGPEAGSDASAMPDYGIVTRGKFDDRDVVGIRLNWDKRYITLAPVATLLGLAFKLYDPDHLLGIKESLGITCALIPTDLQGITIGRRHYPLHCAFPNGPTQGKDVFIPLDFIIGGIQMAGKGWKMLMECLAAGRAISIPAMSVGGSKVCAFTTGAYARIRQQFHLPIGKFGGVGEALARIAAYTYISDATRLFTVSSIDRGERPSVPAAISKYHISEFGRKVISDAMDVHGGKGICMGPKNYLAITYQETPISITVEGANILTRCMIIFGQGAIRCHPYVLKEMQAASNPNQAEGLKQFDLVIFAHFGFTLSNAVRSFFLGLTQARLADAPNREFKRFYQYLTRLSSQLAFAADFALLTLGGNLKRKEKISARLGDVLSMLYLGSAVLKQFEDHQCPEEEKAVVTFALQYILVTAQNQLFDLLVNFPNRFVGWLIRLLVFPLGKSIKAPRDKLGQEIARLMLNPDSLRATLAKGLYLEPNKNNPVGYIEEVLKKAIAAEEIEKRIYLAVREKKINGHTFEEKVRSALTNKLVTQHEAEKVLESYYAKKEIISVDDFAPEEVEGLHLQNVPFHESYHAQPGEVKYHS